MSTKSFHLEIKSFDFVWPKYLIDLKFIQRVYDFDFQISNFKFPSSVRRLSIEDSTGFSYFHSTCEFPEHLECLDIQANFFKLKLPPNLKHFGIHNFISDINWCQNLVSIEFGDYFNASLDHIEFPKSVRIIKFGSEFDEPLRKILFPEELRELYFGRNFCQLFPLQKLRHLQICQLHESLFCITKLEIFIDYFPGLQTLRLLKKRCFHYESPNVKDFQKYSNMSLLNISSFNIVNVLYD